MKRILLMLLSFYIHISWQISMAQGPQIEPTLAGQNFWWTNYFNFNSPIDLAHWEK
jgi:hypothetical protein